MMKNKTIFTFFYIIILLMFFYIHPSYGANDNDSRIIKDIYLILHNIKPSYIQYNNYDTKIVQQLQKYNFGWQDTYISDIQIKSAQELPDGTKQINAILTIESLYNGQAMISCTVDYKQQKNLITLQQLDMQIKIIKEPDLSIKKKIAELRKKIGKTLEEIYEEIMSQIPQEAQKPWSIYLAMGIEYRDNAALLPDGEHKPDDIEVKGDSLVTYSFGGSYDFYTIGKHKFTAGLSYMGIRHKELKSFDGDSVTGTVGWKFTEPRQYQLRTTVAFSHSWYGHNDYSNNISITPGVSYFWNNWTWTDFDYSYSRPVYFNSPSSKEDRGGQYHFFSLGQKFRHNSLLIDGKNTYWGITTLYSTSDTEGSDYDSHSYGLSLRVMQEFDWGITVSTSLARLKTNFQHVNSRSDDNSRRHDTRDSLFVRVSKKFKPWLYGYIGYRYLKNNSNIEYYEYHTNNYSIGIGVEF